MEEKSVGCVDSWIYTRRGNKESAHIDSIFYDLSNYSIEIKEKP